MRSAISASLFLACAALAPALFAQANADGHYSVTWKSLRGVSMQADLVLAGNEGTFKANPPQTTGRIEDPCAQKTHPVSVETAGDELVVAINASKGLAGCRDAKLTLHKVGDGRYEGSFGGGTQVTATRK